LPDVEYDAYNMSLSSAEVEIPFTAKWRVTAAVKTEGTVGFFTDAPGFPTSPLITFVGVDLEVDTGAGYAYKSADWESSCPAAPHEDDRRGQPDAWNNLTDEFELDAGDTLRLKLRHNDTVASARILKASLVVSLASM
jgi:hypothetical protein